MMLGQIDKLLLEALDGEQDFVESWQVIKSIKLKNSMSEAIAIDAISELVRAGLIDASGGTQIKITPLGKEILEKEGRLSWEDKSKIIQ